MNENPFLHLRGAIKRVEIQTRRRMRTSALGRYQSAFRGSGLVYSDLREYQSGDEIKNIHWKASARSGHVYVKTYEEERQLSVLVAIDSSTSMEAGTNFQKFSRALEFGALITLLAQRNRDLAGLCLFSHDIEEFYPPASSRTQFQKIVSALLTHRSFTPKTSVANALMSLNERLRRHSLVFVVSDFVSDPFETELKRLSARHDVVLVRIHQRYPTSFGLVEFKDAESGDSVVIDTSSRVWREKAASLRLGEREVLARLAAAAGTDFMEIEDDVIAPLLSLMHQRERRVR